VKSLQLAGETISSGKLTKANINNRGYNKYLKLEGEVKIEIDKEKFALDAAWDGLKGYQTNTKLKDIRSFQRFCSGLIKNALRKWIL
jgi:hypothetical protein